MKKEIFEIFKKAIKTFENLDEIELIATFGDISRIENSNFYEIDSFIISNKKVHDNFISHLQVQFEKENFRPLVFETITKISKIMQNKSKNPSEKTILIPDLNYRNLTNLLEKEWKSVVNNMKCRLKILHGDQKFPHKIPLLKLSKGELLQGIVKWSQKIKSEEEFKIFQKYLIKIIPKLSRDYDYLDLGNLKEVQKLFNQKFPWDKKLERVRDLIAPI